ncbi:hypothetical protein K525DRAFT_202170 [Schizophyllum commune Loenen D]|nr:hypothetical protein K525DRAFT_202170 [Schizophyllum commune Loenen D]
MHDGRVSGTDTGSRPTRRVLQWSPDVTNENRLRAAFNFLRIAGFGTLGNFLSEALEDHAYSDPAVSKTIDNFLGATSEKPHEHPIAVVEKIYAHRQSQRWRDGRAEIPSFRLPTYALPPSSRLRSPSVSAPCNSTRNALEDWALSRVLKRLRSEANRLSVSPLFNAKGVKPSWTDILEVSLAESEESIAGTAPVIFSVITTLGVNDTMAGRADMTAVEDGELSAAEEEEEEAEGAAAAEEEATGSGKPSTRRTTRNPWLVSTVTILMLLCSRNSKANRFQRTIGAFLYSCQANRDLVAVTSRIGLSVAYSTTLRHLHALAADSARTLVAYGKDVENFQPKFLILFDNVNKMMRAWQSTILRQDRMLNGTAATLVRLEAVPPGCLDRQRLLSYAAQHPRTDLTVDKLYDRLDHSRIRDLGIGVILMHWLKHIPVLARRFQASLDTHYASSLVVHQLQPRKTVVQTMCTTDLEEGTVAGMLKVVDNLVNKQLGCDLRWLQRNMLIICGDLLSVDRLRKVKVILHKWDNAVNYGFILPFAQLFHLKWAWQKSIFSMHWWRDAFSDDKAQGLTKDINLLGRGKFNHEKCDFYPAHHILEDIFDTMICHSLRLQRNARFGSSADGDSSQVKLLDTLERAFSPGGTLSSCSFDELKVMAGVTYDRFCSLRSADAASGEHERPEADWGEPCHAYRRRPANHPTASSATKASGRGRKKAIAVNSSDGVVGDQSLQNDCHFMRTTIWYLVLTHGISRGDIGHVFCVLDFLTFSFWGAGATNYGNEMLEMAASFMCEFPPDLQIAIKENYLANPTGRPNHYQELDLLQEHFNKVIKRVADKTEDFGSKHLSETISLNIPGFSALRNIVAAAFLVKRSGANHKNPEKTNDINRLGAHYQTAHRLEYCANRQQPYRVANEFESGYSLLYAGQLDTFLERTSADMLDLPPTADTSPSTVISDLPVEGENYVPPSPLVIEQGILGPSTYGFDD